VDNRIYLGELTFLLDGGMTTFTPMNGIINWVNVRSIALPYGRKYTIIKFCFSQQVTPDHRGGGVFIIMQITHKPAL